MCNFKYNKFLCPDCIFADGDMISIPSSRAVSVCSRARKRRARPINCRYHREKWSGEWTTKNQPCMSCRRKRGVSREKVERWIQQEEMWREQNPLDDRVGENSPEADRGWRTPSIHSDAASTSA